MSLEDTNKSEATPAPEQPQADPVPSPISSDPKDFMPPEDVLKGYIVPQDIIVKIAGFLALIPNNYQPHERVQAFNEVMSIIQSRFQLKLGAEAQIINGMIFAKPTVVFVEDILAHERQLQEMKKKEAGTDPSPAPQA